jgi:hypothetical protein
VTVSVVKTAVACEQLRLLQQFFATQKAMEISNNAGYDCGRGALLLLLK